MMPTLFILFIGLGIYIGTLEGAHHAYDYIFNVDLQNERSIIMDFAFGQAFLVYL